MKATTTICFCAILFSCNTKGSKQPEDSTAALASDLMAPTSAVQKVSSSLVAASDGSAVDPSGTWAATGEGNTTMVIDKNKQEVYYPDSSQTYTYKVEGDSIKIKDKGTFLLTMKGTDTLIFVGSKRFVWTKKRGR